MGWRLIWRIPTTLAFIVVGLTIFIAFGWVVAGAVGLAMIFDVHGYRADVTRWGLLRWGDDHHVILALVSGIAVLILWAALVLLLTAGQAV